MTRPRPWPRRWLNAASDCMMRAREIGRLGDEAKRALESGNSYKARMAIAEMQRAAALILADVLEAKAGVEEE